MEEKWKAVSCALISSAEDLLGTVIHSQPYWFHDFLEELKPLLRLRNEAYSKWLGTGKQEDLNKFKEARRNARRAVRRAKNIWFQEKAEQIERERFGGKKVWKCIRDMQRCRRGLLPVKAVTIEDENGVPCTSTATQHQRWRRHFSKVLNVRSPFDDRELGQVRQREVDQTLGDIPTSYDVKKALGKLRGGKAAGSSGILPEMLKAGMANNESLDMLTDLVRTVWQERCVPQEWVNSILVPIPKKGNLRSCENWRGIALLDVVGKVAARVVQSRLQSLAERELPESQCGFRWGRGCTDMIYMVRQLTEKAIEHQTQQHLIFVDLHKAYDSVPREALWVALRKLGVPEMLVDTIKSFHSHMKTRVRVDGELLEEIEVENGLRQGCTMAPTLFNLYFCIVAERWLERIRGVDGIGTEILCKFDQQLFRRSTKNACKKLLEKGEFADDVVLLASTRAAAEIAIKEYIVVASAFGLSVSVQKTKLMVVGHGVTEEDRRPIALDEGRIEWVSEFPYLGSLVTDDGRIHGEVDRRIASASRAFGALKQAVFRDAHLSLFTKRSVYRACVLSVLLYGSECWVPLRRHLKKLNSFHHRCLRSVLGITNQRQWEERISSIMVREQWGDLEMMETRLRRRRLEWLGHLARMKDHRLPKICLFGWLPKTRPCRGPRRRWRDVVKRDLKLVEVRDGEWYDHAQNRRKWRDIWSHRLTEHQQAQAAGLSGGEKTVVCSECGRHFRRESDKARHKCIAERRRPVCEQLGAVECDRCGRWLRSRGGLAVHRCRRETNDLQDGHQTSRPIRTASASQGPVKCSVCMREFRRQGDLKRHKCNAEREARERSDHATQCSLCQRWFRGARGLAIHKGRIHAATK